MRDVIASEWLKLRSVRSTWWALGAAFFLMPLTGLLIGMNTSSDQLGNPSYDALDTLTGTAIVQFAFGVLGVLSISPEYGTGLIRTTFAAVPSRSRVIAVKAGLLAAVFAVAGTVISLVTFLVGQAALPAGLGVSLGDPGVLRAVFGAAFYMVFIGMFGFALGALIRHTQGALSVLMAVVFVIMGILPSLVPQSLQDSVAAYSFTGLGRSLIVVKPVDGVTTPLTALVLCLVYAAVVLVPAFILTNRRDP